MDEKKSGRMLGDNLATVNGQMYTVDTVKKTVKRVYNDIKDIPVMVDEMPLTVYQRYFRDNFPGEDCPIKKDKLFFRGYRIYFSMENGFVVDDTTDKYSFVDTGIEGIPTPKELGDWFVKPKRKEDSPEELAAAIKRGKELAEKAKEIYTKDVVEDVEVDFEKLRRKVLRTIEGVQSKTLVFDCTEFPNMIPFKRWKKKANSLLSQWKEKQIRYGKFLAELALITKEETFSVEEKNHRSAFVGTMLPEHNKVGMLIGDKISVDDKMIDAVPFLMEYLLFHEKRAMPQLMKYGRGEITAQELLKNPIVLDWKEDYTKNAIVNTSENARLISMVYYLVGIIPPQDLLFEADLVVGDKILLYTPEGLKTKTVADTSKGIVLGKEVGLLKYDSWIKINK